MHGEGRCSRTYGSGENAQELLKDVPRLPSRQTLGVVHDGAPRHSVKRVLGNEPLCILHRLGFLHRSTGINSVNTSLTCHG